MPTLRTWTAPVYEYGADMTLGTLLQAWIDHNNGTEAEAINVLEDAKVRGAAKSFNTWMQGKPTRPLLTNISKSFQKTTGINLDRWLMVHSKQQILREQPELEGVVTFDRFHTRAELAEEAKRYSDMYGGSRYIAAQLDISEGEVNNVILGRRKLAGSLLRKMIVGLSQGLLEAPIEDVILIIFCAIVFGQRPEDVIPGVTNFQSVLKKFYTGYTLKKLAQKSILGSSSIGRAKNWTPDNDVKVQPRTLLLIFRELFRRKYNKKLLKEFDRAFDEFIEARQVSQQIDLPGSKKPDPKPSQPKGQPKLVKRNKAPPKKKKPGLEIQMVETPPVKPEPKPPARPSVPIPEAPAELTERFVQAAAAGLRHAAMVLENPEADVPTTRKPTQDHPLIIELGKTLDGIEHCLPTDWLPDTSGAVLSDEDFWRIKEALKLLRKLFIGLSAYQGLEGQQIVKMLRPEIDETLLTLLARRGFYDVLGAMDQIEGIGQAMRTAGNIKEGGG